MARDAAATGHRVVDVEEMLALWRIREDGAGLAARSLDRPAHAGWEDAAVPPARLGGYLRAFDDLLRAHGYDGVPYGHFGDGCVHVRIDFGLDSPGGRGGFRTFLEEAAALVASYDGTLSGEHGDGRARSELLGAMYSQDALDLFRQVKRALDPAGVLNPGCSSTRVRSTRTCGWRPAVAAADEPAAAARRRLAGGRGAPLHGRGPLPGRQHRQRGRDVPLLRGDPRREGLHRGRARVLQEMVDGRLVRDGWRSDEVHEALDLCLSCKGCSTDCPTGVDMATYKAEALHQRYRGRLRPRSHYALGRLPLWARLTQPVAPLANLALRSPAVRRASRWAAGIDQRRSIPAFASRSFRTLAGERTRRQDPDVVIWADSFTDHFASEPGMAAVALLESAGLRVGVVRERACCGLTWVSTGQLDQARRIVGRTVGVLHEYVARGIPVVGLEPSCLAALRSDAAELTADRAGEVARGVHTLAELLETVEVAATGPHRHARGGAAALPPHVGARLRGRRPAAGPHRRHRDPARRLLRAGRQLRRREGALRRLGRGRRAHPAAGGAGGGEDAVVLADGFSCRTQLADLADVRAVHMSELLLSPRDCASRSGS